MPPADESERVRLVREYRKGMEALSAEFNANSQLALGIPSPEATYAQAGPRPRAINPPPRYEERVDAKSGWAHRLLSTLDSLSSWALFLASIIGAFVFRSFLEAFVDVIFDALEYHIAEYFRRRGYE